MDDYNRYVTAINKIFDYIEKIKAGWNNIDNKNYIDTINDFKPVVTSKADEYKKPPTVKLEKTAAELEVEQEAALEEANKKNLEQQRQQRMMPQVEEGGVEKIPIHELPSSFNNQPMPAQVERGRIG